ncbi:YicC family protein, partial [candidate division GN15 bacterium]|nr:YicC family protein [candidate division GN15 bacterium]
MNSMTGFGRAEKKTRFGLVSVELSSVNNRFLEFTIRTPRHIVSLETSIRELISSQIRRGKVMVIINIDESDEAAEGYPINVKALRAYYRQLEKARKDLKLDQPVTMSDLLLLPEITSPERQSADQATLWKALRPIVKAAVGDLVAMRRKEGEAMAKDMRQRLAASAKLVSAIEKRSPKIVKAYREKLMTRIDELLQAPVRDNLRLEEEVAYVAERTDITEECIRFKSHVDQFRKALSQKEPAGKRLNFLLQEMNREVNTIGSKCADASLSSTVITL